MGLASRIVTYLGPFQGFGPDCDQVPNFGPHYEHCSCYLDFFFSETKFSETETVITLLLLSLLEYYDDWKDLVDWISIPEQDPSAPQDHYEGESQEGCSGALYCTASL